MQPSAPSYQGTPQDAPSSTVSLEEWRMQRLAALAGQHEIRSDWVARLRALENFTITLLCDDSGSMATVCAGGGASPSNPYARQNTRWDELRNTVSMLVQLATALDPSGAVDVFFLNRPPLLGVRDAAQVQVAFATPPQGFTPLARSFNQILQAKAQALAERKLLLVIATDGQPTDDHGNVRIPEFLGALANMPQNMYVQIMACTDDEQSMSWLNAADSGIPRLDVTDDYFSERREVLSAQGAGFHFSQGDWVCKLLLGSVDPYFDSLDSGSQRRNGGGEGCCTIA